MALAAYNYGMGNVEKITGNNKVNFNKLPDDVKDYVKEVLGVDIIPIIKPKPQQTGMMAVN